MSLQTASIAQKCKALRLPAVGAQFASLAEEAGQRNHSHLHYIEALLQAELEDRERRSIELRMKEAHLPRIKTLEEFDFAQSPHIPASRIRTLAEGGYLERAEPSNALALAEEIQGGAATFKGTRLLVHQIASLLLEGVAEAELRTDYPHLTPEMIEAAEIYARSHPPRGRPRKPAWRNNKPSSSQLLGRRSGEFAPLPRG